MSIFWILGGIFVLAGMVFVVGGVTNRAGKVLNSNPPLAERPKSSNDLEDDRSEDELLGLLEEEFMPLYRKLVNFLTRPESDTWMPPWVAPELRRNPAALYDALRERRDLKHLHPGVAEESITKLNN